MKRENGLSLLSHLTSFGLGVLGDLLTLIPVIQQLWAVLQVYVLILVFCCCFVFLVRTYFNWGQMKEREGMFTYLFSDRP